GTACARERAGGSFPALAPCDGGCRPSSVAARSGRLPWGSRRTLRGGSAPRHPRRGDRVMAGREPVGIASARPGLAASAAIALAYGAVLPVLPTVVASSPSPARAIAELMAVYSAAMGVTAPIWVRVCRQLPAHLLVRLSLLGQAAAMIMLLWS